MLQVLKWRKALAKTVKTRDTDSSLAPALSVGPYFFCSLAHIQSFSVGFGVLTGTQLLVTGEKPKEADNTHNGLAAAIPFPFKHFAFTPPGQPNHETDLGYITTRKILQVRTGCTTHLVHLLH